MMKMFFYALIDTLTESVVYIFYARNLKHAMQIVKAGLKNKSIDDEAINNLELVQISDLIEVPNDFEKIVDNLTEDLGYESCSVKDFLGEVKNE